MKFYLQLLMLIFLLTGCKPNLHSDKAVAKTMAQYVKALQKGDAQALANLYSAKQRQDFDAAFIQKGFPPRQDINGFNAEGFVIRDKTAAIFGRMVKNGKPSEDEEALLFVLEDAQWRIERQTGSNTSIHRPAFAPPEGGKFISAGKPWNNIPGLDLSTDIVRKTSYGYQLQAVSDESFLYLRWLFKHDLPADGTPLPKENIHKHLPSIEPRVLEVQSQTGGKWSIVLDSVISTSFRNGKNTFSLAYSVDFRDHDFKSLFGTSLGSEDGLFTRAGREMVVKIPLESMGIKPDIPLVIRPQNTDKKMDVAKF